MGDLAGLRGGFRKKRRSGDFFARSEEPVVRKDVLQLANDGTVGLDLDVSPVAQLLVEPLVFAANVHSPDEG